jgi:hypothetical protein
VKNGGNAMTAQNARKVSQLGREVRRKLPGRNLFLKALDLLGHRFD